MTNAPLFYYKANNARLVKSGAEPPFNTITAKDYESWGYLADYLPAFAAAPAGGGVACSMGHEEIMPGCAECVKRLPEKFTSATQPEQAEGLVGCPKCGAPCERTVNIRGGDYGWSTTDEQRADYRYAAQHRARVDEDALANVAFRAWNSVQRGTSIRDAVKAAIRAVLQAALAEGGRRG